MDGMSSGQAHPPNSGGRPWTCSVQHLAHTLNGSQSRDLKYILSYPAGTNSSTSLEQGLIVPLCIHRALRQVLFVARDEVAFDFLDALSPGCTVLFPEVGSVRR